MMDTPILILSIVCGIQFILNVWSAIKIVDTMAELDDMGDRLDNLEQQMFTQEEINKIPF